MGFSAPPPSVIIHKRHPKVPHHLSEGGRQTVERRRGRSDFELELTMMVGASAKVMYESCYSKCFGNLKPFQGREEKKPERKHMNQIVIG